MCVFSEIFGVYDSENQAIGGSRNQLRRSHGRASSLHRSLSRRCPLIILSSACRDKSGHLRACRCNGAAPWRWRGVLHAHTVTAAAVRPPGGLPHRVGGLRRATDSRRAPRVAGRQAEGGQKGRHLPHVSDHGAISVTRRLALRRIRPLALSDASHYYQHTVSLFAVRRQITGDDEPPSIRPVNRRPNVGEIIFAGHLLQRVTWLPLLHPAGTRQ
jgi:hypothetical protein